MRATRLQDALKRLTTAIRDVKSELAAMKAEHDPLASHIFVSRPHYRNINDTKSGKRREMIASSIDREGPKCVMSSLSDGFWCSLISHVVVAVVVLALSGGLLNAGQESAAPTARPHPTPHLRPTASAIPSATPTVNPTATPTPPDNTFLTGLYAYYELDEASGNALDASGNSHDLSQIGIIGSAAGKINTARVWSGGFSGPFLFDSSSTTTFQPGSNHLFVSCWIKSAVTDYNYDAGIAGKFVLPHASWLLFRQSDTDGSQLKFVCMQDGNTIGATAIGPVLNDTNWHFVVGGWDGTNLKISVDGGAFSTTAFTGPIFGDGTGAFQIGAEAASNTWNGLIDEVAIWIGRNDLTISEVQQLYNNGAGLPFSSFR